MVRAEIDCLRVANQGGIPHQVADSAVEMRGGCVQILSILDSDQIGDLRREERAAVPADDRTTLTEHPGVLTKVLYREILEPLVRIVSDPWHLRLPKQPHTEWLVGHAERDRCGRPAIGHMRFQNQCRHAPGKGREGRGARNARPVPHIEQVTVCAIRIRERDSFGGRRPAHPKDGAVR